MFPGKTITMSGAKPSEVLIGRHKRFINNEIIHQAGPVVNINKTECSKGTEQRQQDGNVCKVPAQGNLAGAALWLFSCPLGLYSGHFGFSGSTD